ncbi:MAG: hypothetical protein LIO85_05170 [Rikenellaceae bacterium]|nr:hypothetical protein [Rikenellaceae bacterium]
MDRLKKYLYTLLLACAALTPSCTHKFGEYDDNPNEMPLWSLHPAGIMEMLVYSGTEGFLNRTY